jgi:hypothetical protein
MRSLAAVGICLLVILRCAAAAEPLEGWDMTKTFTITVTDADLRNTPSWSGEGNPPLSARKVIRLLTPVKESLIHNEKGYHPWRLSRLGLKQGDQAPGKWYWVACYEAFVDVAGGGQTGGPLTLYLVVLMDGRVLKPVVTQGR